MIPMSSIAADLVNNASASVRYVRVESWYDGILVSEDVPVLDAIEEADASLRVPERLTFGVPAVVDGYSWVPVETGDPLGAQGQRVRISLGVGVDNGAVEWINRGWFLVNTASTQGDSISVEALGLLALVDEAVLPNEYQPKTGATLASVCRALIEPGLTINDDAAPPDRALGISTVTFSDNRLDCLWSVLDAWPAAAQMTEDGFLRITAPPAAPVADNVVLTLTDQRGGTVIEPSADSTRDGAYNAVVAKGQYPDSDSARAGQEIVATVSDTDPASPYRIGGPFSPYLVPYGYASPLLNTAAQVKAAANTVLRRLRRNASRTVSVTAVPHPGVQLGDVVSLTSARLGLAGALGTIDRYTLPLTAAGGAMSLTVRLEG